MCAACCNILQYFLGGFGFAGSRFSRNQHALISELAPHRPVRRVTNCKSLKQKNIFVHRYLFFPKISFNWSQDFTLKFLTTTFSRSNSPTQTWHFYTFQRKIQISSCFVFNWSCLTVSSMIHNIPLQLEFWYAKSSILQQKIWYCVPLASIKFPTSFLRLNFFENNSGRSKLVLVFKLAVLLTYMCGGSS